MFQVNNWTGALVFLVLVGVVLGLLLGFQEVLNPISAQDRSEQRRVDQEHQQRMYEIQEAQKQAELHRVQLANDMAERRALQNLDQEREQHEVVMAFLNRFLPVVIVGAALGLAGLGAGLGYYLYCRGLEMRARQNPAAVAPGGGRIVQFPVQPQDRRAAG